MNLTQLQTRGASNGEILSLLVQGYSPKEIASKVGISDVAVHSRLARIRVKEGVQTNTGLVGKVLEIQWANRARSRRAHGGEAA